MSEGDRNRVHEGRDPEHANPREHVREMEEHVREMGSTCAGWASGCVDSMSNSATWRNLEEQDDRGVDRGTSWPSGG